MINEKPESGSIQFCAPCVLSNAVHIKPIKANLSCDRHTKALRWQHEETACTRLGRITRSQDTDVCISKNTHWSIWCLWISGPRRMCNTELGTPEFYTPLREVNARTDHVSVSMNSNIFIVKAQEQNWKYSMVQRALQQNYIYVQCKVRTTLIKDS